MLPWATLTGVNEFNMLGSTLYCLYYFIGNKADSYQ